MNDIEVIDNGEESDSNDSVFSSSSSDDLNMFSSTNGGRSLEIRDIYLGGSCLLRTKWRQEFAIPYLKENNISYYLPNLHESIANKTFAYNQHSRNSNLNEATSLPFSEKRLKFNNSVDSDEIATNIDINHDIESNSDNHNNHQQNQQIIQNHHHHPFVLKNGSMDSDVGGESNTNNGVHYDTVDVLNKKNYNLRFSDVNILCEEESPIFGDKLLFNPNLLDSSRVLFFLITNETRSLAPMTLAAHYIGLGYNVVLCVQMLPENCKIGRDNVSLH